MIRRLLCVLILAAGVLVLPGTPASAGTFWGTMVVKFHGVAQCLEVTSGAGGKSDGTQLWQWSCNGNSNQLWRVYAIPCGADTCFLFVNTYSGRCMARSGGGTGNGTRVIQSPCSDSNSTEWWFWDTLIVGGDRWAVLSAYPSNPKCLQHHNPPAGNGDPLDIWTCNTSYANQRLDVITA
jgi:hypothetical protein